MVLGSIKPKFIFVSLLVLTKALMSFDKILSVLPAPVSWSRLPDIEPRGGSEDGRTSHNRTISLVSDFIFHFVEAVHDDFYHTKWEI